MKHLLQLLAKRTLLTISVLLLTLLAYSQKLDVEGSIRIDDSGETIPSPGTIRYNASTNDFEGWNGAFWASLTGFQLGSLTDINGNVYKTITIGTQEWMAQNLRTTRYKNGNIIPNVPNNTDWGNLVSGAYCWYNNDNSYEQPYGKLYNWYAVNDSRGLCPTGWHEPSDAEWTTLTDFLGGLSVAGGPMKETGTTHWNSPNTGATNESGFTGLPGGLRYTSGFDIGNFGYWWSSTESSSSTATARCRILLYNNDNVDRNVNFKTQGFSVRCVRD